MGKGIKMTPNETRIAIKIMNKISQHPCAKIFLEPVDTNIYPAYYDVIIEPVDISMVNQRLKSYDYHLCSEWKHDMKQISINAMTFFGPGSAQEMLANRLYIIFEKEYETLINMTTSKWVRTCFLLMYKVQFLAQKLPEEMSGVSAVVMNLTSGRYKSLFQDLVVPQPLPEFIEIPAIEEPKKQNENVKPRVSIGCRKETDAISRRNATDRVSKRGPSSPRKKSPVRKPSHRYDTVRFTEMEVEGLMCALSLLPDADDVREVARIVIRSQPELRLKMPNPKVDIESLTNHTLKLVMDFAKRRFRELHLEFPTQSIVL